MSVVGVARLAEKLRGMLDANETVPEMERLERDEFVVNTHIQEQQMKDNLEAVRGTCCLATAFCAILSVSGE